MQRTALVLLTLATLVYAFIRLAGPAPYDEKADAKLDLKNGLASLTDDRRLLVVFGANWCGPCRRLDQRMKQPPLKEFLDNNYVVVKVDVGRWDRNQDVVSWFGNPTRKGIPARAIMNAQGDIIHKGSGSRLSSGGPQSSYEYMLRLTRNLDG